jgi:molecular chaperone HtpG
MYGGMFGEGAMPTDETLIVNSSNDLIKTLLKINTEDGRTDDVDMIARHIYDLAIMSHKAMSPDLMSAFIERSNKILTMVAKK